MAGVLQGGEDADSRAHTKSQACVEYSIIPYTSTSLHCPICVKDIMVIVLLLQVMGDGKVGGGSFMLEFGWGDRRWVSYFFYFLFCFCGVVNFSFMAGS